MTIKQIHELKSSKGPQSRSTHSWVEDNMVAITVMAYRIDSSLLDSVVDCTLFLEA